MAQELKIVDSKEVVATGFVTYTQEVAALAAQGYVVDIRSKYCPQWQLGLFVCNMLLLEDEDGKEEVNVPPVTAPTEPIAGVEKTIKKPGRPTRADKVKAELSAKLGEDAKSIR